jgi:hypothetical protein
MVSVPFPRGSYTFLAFPLKPVILSINNTNIPLLPRIGDLFSLETDDQDKYRVTHRPRLTAKLQHS